MNGPSEEPKARLDALLHDFEALGQNQVGYPCNQDFDYSALLPFLQYCANNVGDPFHDSNFRSNTHEMEREVIGQFADMMHLAREQAWGYVTSGGTEGNMYGLYLERELFPNGVVYFSQDTHYSVLKILRVLKARNIMIKSQDNGEIDYDDLYETIRINRDVPVIFAANTGTTMKGAVDDVDKVRGILKDLAITESYLHADAALSGMILPFVEDPQPYGFDAGFDIMANNEVGVIADISRVLADNNLNIEAISAEGHGEKGVITLTTDDYDGALQALTNAGFKTVTDDALILRLPDEPGALAKVAERFKDTGVNIQSLHILARQGGYTTVALSADDRAKAETLVDRDSIV